MQFLNTDHISCPLWPCLMWDFKEKKIFRFFGPKRLKTTMIIFALNIIVYSIVYFTDSMGPDSIKEDDYNLLIHAPIYFWSLGI